MRRTECQATLPSEHPALASTKEASIRSSSRPRAKAPSDFPRGKPASESNATSPTPKRKDGPSGWLGMLGKVIPLVMNKSAHGRTLLCRALQVSRAYWPLVRTSFGAVPETRHQPSRASAQFRFRTARELANLNPTSMRPRNQGLRTMRKMAFEYLLQHRPRSAERCSALAPKPPLCTLWRFCPEQKSASSPLATSRTKGPRKHAWTLLAACFCRVFVWTPRT